MFEKILIANRGEIACRIIRSARALGIKTVAVYSEADRDSLHRQLADEAVAIGPAPSAESYLRGERIIEACRATGAQAVHPGFGFLAENAAFVSDLEAAGLVFIGPPPPAIAAMGDKIESKRLAAEAGVSTVPGHMDLIADADEAARIAGEIGYPVMIKASAGGGGKGMRIARDEKEAREGFRSAQSEARSSFGDDRVFIEKFVEQPRHIEIQVLADAHGTVLHLGERECSIQRRHQKVIEEAPSPFIDAATRAAMGEQAVALARAVDYRSAGTVEFIVDKDRNFYFLEMNTRIQVEHPVTEMVTGIDLVEWMIRIAAGEPLAFGQDDVRLEGWSLEARVYAEDPLRNFMPSIGRLTRYREPPIPEPATASSRPHVRIDSGVVEGSEISIYYDPMIAKLVTYGADRTAAIREMLAALDGFYIRGINHNVSFLSAIVGSERFRRGDLTTGFIAESFPEGFAGLTPTPAQLEVLVALAAALRHREAERECRIEGQLEGARPFSDPADWVVACNREFHPRRVTAATGAMRVEGPDGRAVTLSGSWQPGQPLFAGRIGDRALTVQVDRRGPAYLLTHGGVTLEMLVMTPRAADLAELMPVKAPPDLSRYLLSPMPGLLVSVAVAEGQEVKAGEELAVVEAMKMENVLRAERDGVVLSLLAAPGDSLSVDQAILEFR